MKTLRVIVLAAFLGSPLLAADWQPGVIGPFQGLNNTDNSLIIPSGAAQDLLNVDITPGGRSVKKRKGFGTAITLDIATSAVHGVYSFYDSSGNDIVLTFNDTRLTSSVSGGTATQLMSSATVAQTWQCVDSNGYAYCAGTSRDWILKTEGTTWSQLSGFVSTGTILAGGPERLVMAGFSGANSNRIDFSKANDKETWTVGSQPTDPITFTITTPGSKITHLVYAFKKIYWFKESSFGYILEGAELADWKIVPVSMDIGTLDNTSTQDTDGNLYFRDQDGHLYVTDGSGVTKISRDIGQSIGLAGLRTSNHVTLTSASDWGAGTFTGNTVYVDTETSSGNLQTTFPDTFGTFRDGTLSTKNVWTSWKTDNRDSFSNSISGGKLLVNLTEGGTGYVGVITTNKINPLQPGTTVHVRVESNPVNASAEQGIILSPFIGGSEISDVYGYGPLFLSLRAVDATKSVVQTVVVGGDTLTSFPSTEFTLPFDLDVWIATTTYAISINDVLFTSGTHSGDSITSDVYAYLFMTPSSARPVAASCRFDNFSVAPQTFTFVSASQSVSSAITSWDSFTTTKNDASGSLALGIRSSASNAYTSITAGNTPTIATATYWQAISTFTMTSSSSTVPLSISDITQNWFEGYTADKSYASFFDNKVMFSVASGAGQLTNNRVLIYDLITPGWTIYDLAANGFYKRNGSLYFGSASAGYVYKFGDVDTDNGSAINAYWKSKDFFGDNPFVDKEWVNVSVFGDSVSNSSGTITYTVNGSSSASFTAPFGNANTFARKNMNLPAGKVGATLNVQFGNNAADQPFEVMAIQYGWRAKPWVP